MGGTPCSLSPTIGTAFREDSAVGEREPETAIKQMSPRGSGQSLSRTQCRGAYSSSSVLPVLLRISLINRDGIESLRLPHLMRLAARVRVR